MAAVWRPVDALFSGAMSSGTAHDDVEHRLRDRLAELRAELGVGEQRLTALDRETDAVRATMLRISGAIQVLTELLDPAPNGTPERSAPLERAEPRSA
jgi:hypothetical protein